MMMVVTTVSFSILLRSPSSSEPIRKVTCRILDSKKPSEENPR